MNQKDRLLFRVSAWLDPFGYLLKKSRKGWPETSPWWSGA